ncbi:MAG: hypothetical protein L3K06_00790 [Thermoplasmata archaeon]|nr:hypothetical protein [Thermoplasmata archaeon]MCI4353886.1 hypothetical protein [Thermoplasmata archaeon]
MIPAPFVDGLALGLAIATVVYLLLWWRTRRSHALGPAGRETDPPPVANDAVAPMADPAAPDTRSVADPLPATGGGVPAVDPAVGSGSDLTASPRAPEPDPAPARRLPPTETLRLSQRVILHVYAQGVLPPGEVAPPGLCQGGMIEALGIPQAGLAAVLRRLEAAEILTTERGHVRGRDRRVKIYRLSARGLQLARELRSRPRAKARR